MVILISTSACAQLANSPKIIQLEKSIKEYVLSKDESHDFLKDQVYIEKIDKLLSEYTKRGLISSDHIAIGHLTETNIPELIVFREKDSSDASDEGSLEVYSFDGEKYTLLDKVSMNFDNTNYQLEVGKLSKDQTGIYLNNQAGSQFGVTYGYILEDGKLKSVLNPKKVNLISIDTDNEIKDITKDGILEFSVHLIDPESPDKDPETADKIKLWYRWDGKDGAELISLEKEKGENSEMDKVSDQNILKEAEELLENEDQAFLDYLKENQQELTAADNTKLLEDYISLLEDRLYSEEGKVNKLIEQYESDAQEKKLTEQHGLTLERLNDSEYLRRQKVLSSHQELKEKIIKNLNLGYKLDKIGDKYRFVINYQLFIDDFGNNILNEYKDFLRILELNSQESYLKTNKVNPPLEELAERIALAEDFRLTYPYSEKLGKIDDFYKKCINIFFSHDMKASLAPKETTFSKVELLDRYEKIKEKYKHTYFADIIDRYIQENQPLQENEAS